ncbi:retrovirus-related pol polyprotein from transposon TNT 1-94 [Tanacetum coccineum]
MTTLAEHIIVAGAENRPPMIKKSMYDSWATQQLQDDCHVQSINIILHGLPPDVYALVNHQEAAKDIWDRVETLYEYYWIFSQLINDMHNRDDNAANLSQYQVFECSSTRMEQVSEFPGLDSGLAVPTFQQGDDLIECINKAMAFLSAVASRFPSSNNQLRMSSNPINQATIQDGRVTIQQVQGRQTQTGQAKVVKCYNCLGEGHMAKQCTQPKRPRSSAWFKEKLLLAKVQEAGQILDEEKLAFIVDPGIAEVQVAQQTIPQNSAFQTEDLDAYDSDCDDTSSAKAVLMANLSSCDLDVLFEVPYSNFIRML